MVHGLGALVPNVFYTGHVTIINATSPYFCSFVPLESITFQGETPNKIIVPAVKSISYGGAMKEVKIPDGTERVSVGCTAISELEIPDSVKELSISNVSDELANNLQLPSNLEMLIIENSYSSVFDKGLSPLSNEGLNNIELPETLKVLVIDYWDSLNEIAIDNSLECLILRGHSDEKLEKLTINGNVGYLEINQGINNYVVNGSVSDYSNTCGKNYYSDLQSIREKYLEEGL